MKLDHFATAIRSLPDLTPARRAALDALLREGLPDTDHEDWKYTDLSVLERLSPDDVAPRTENHEFPAAYDCGLDALSAALAGGRQTLVVNGRLELDMSRHQRLRLQVRGDAELVLTDVAATRFATFFAAIEVAPGARLQLLRVQDAPEGSQRLSRMKIELARDAQLEAVSIDLGGGFSRHDFDVSLAQAGAAAQVHGLYVVGGTAHVDNHTRIDHRAPHCTSRENFRGIAFGKARAVYNGKVVVHAGAQKTDSEQRVANLLLSPTTEVNAKPELEIYADDVKCAHGATFGQLDQNAIFYLRSRGIPETQARSMLTGAFAQEILGRIPDASVRERLTQDVLRRLPS
jgi:Fe-S cluster assembly protein SufD